MNVLVTGGGGQLGRALQHAAPPRAEISAATHAELDITDPSAVAEYMLVARPDIVINTAAFTQVDAAEADPFGAERTNVDGVRVLAKACRSSHAWLIHVSTDYVFDGESKVPYLPSDTPRPLSVYGRTKWAGEEAARATLPTTSTIVRASWLYSVAGRNFVTRMLELMARMPVLRVVNDQAGAPTACWSLADVLWGLAAQPVAGTFHWSDGGTATWYDFAVAIAEDGASIGLLPQPPKIIPITTAEYPTPARRPRYSGLDRSTTEELLGCRAISWRDALRRTLTDIARDRAGGAAG